MGQGYSASLDRQISLLFNKTIGSTNCKIFAIQRAHLLNSNAVAIERAQLVE